MTTKLEDIIKKFVDDQCISCEEVIYQSDHVIENVYEFIYELIKEVGYWYKEETWGGNYE